MTHVECLKLKLIPTRFLNEARRFFGLLLVVCLAGECLGAGPGLPVISMGEHKGEYSFGLSKLPARHLARMKKYAVDDERFKGVLSVFAGGEVTDDLPAMLGSYRLVKGALVFRPRYPLQAGLVYTVVYNRGERVTTQKGFVIPKKVVVGEAARVTGVYPSGDVLPENLLRFYVHFSRPMSRGQAYRRITLFDHEAGANVDRPFLELEEELWDPAGRRFTLLFDPGRVKVGLRPNVEVGPSLNRGREYTLRIDGGWLDAESNGMSEGFERRFRVVGPDVVQPDVGRWEIAAPKVGGVGELVVKFGEPLDRGQVMRLIVVKDGKGRVVAGYVVVDGVEERWRFRPVKAWVGGEYRLVVATILEDRAGNSLGRPFEVDMEKRGHAKLGEFVVRKFKVE